MRMVLAPAVMGLMSMCLPPSAADGGERGRPLRIADLFAQEQVPHHFRSHSDFSPDGLAYAFGKGRPIDGQKVHALSQVGLGGTGNGDIWVQLAPGETPFNVTDGVDEASGWFAPQWSADGQNLAMISVSPEGSYLWVWNRSTRELRRLTDQSVRAVFWWLDERRLLCATSSFNLAISSAGLDTLRSATHMWQKIAPGKEATASVLETGVPIDPKRRTTDQLLVIDLSKGKVGAFAHLSSVEFPSPSPDRNAVAYARQLTVPAPQPGRTLNFAVSEAKHALEVLGLDGRSLLQPAQKTSDILVRSIRWSPDGKQIAFLSFGATRKESVQLLRLRVGAPTLERIDLGELYPLPAHENQSVELEWTRTGDLIVLASVVKEGEKPSVTARRDWWLLGRNGARRNLTATLKKVPDFGYPSALIALSDGASFVGLADGELWRIGVKGGPSVNLTEKLEPRVAWIAGRDSPHDRDKPVSKLILRTGGDGKPQTYHTIDLRPGAIAALEAPDPNAALGTYSSASGDTVFYKTGAQGSFVWRKVARTGRNEELMAANSFLQEIAAGELKRFDYTSLEGESLSGWIILPSDYRQGRRYPLLTWVYGGTMYDEKLASMENIGWVAALNMQIPAAHGYAVLLPSMPLDPQGQASDPLFKLTNGVLPALDAAIALGIADPERLLVAGHSFGGYCTYGLVTQTNRFKGAVALAGFANLVSAYGIFMADRRYSEMAGEWMFQAGWSETGQGSLGGPPWEDYGRYLRNSPIFYVDRVRTPVMMIHGDLDFVPMEEAEQFYTALHRQGKRAQLARYWGETHILKSPANIRDMWARIFAWLDDTADVQRDANGGLVFAGERVRSREGRPGWTPEQFKQLD